MRYLFQILLLGLVSFTNSSFAQKINPPGTIWLRENLYIDLAPIPNVGYKEYEYVMSRYIKYNLDSFQNIVASLPYFKVNRIAFLDSLKITPNPDSAELKIDPDATISWDKPASFEIYLNLPSYNNYPLVNVSYELAKKICAWRTAMVQLNYAGVATKKKRQKHYKKVRYRLATKEEWEYALSKFSNSKRFSSSKRPLPAKENYFSITNLSELVEEKNILVNKAFDRKPSPDLVTFRCVCEVED